MHLRPSHLKLLNRSVQTEGGEVLSVRGMISTPSLLVDDRPSLALIYRKDQQWWTLDQAGQQQCFFDQKLLQAMVEQESRELYEKSQSDLLSMFDTPEDTVEKIDWSSFRFGPRPEDPEPDRPAPQMPAPSSPKPWLSAPRPSWAN